MVVLRGDLFLANPWTATNAVVEASAVGMQRSRSLPQRKDPLHQKQGASQQSDVDVGPVEAIEGAAESAPARDEDAGIGLAPGDAEVGVFLVVLQQHIEVRLMVLDQVGFKSQCLRFAIGHDEFDLANLSRHQADTRRQIMPTAEIAADPAAQRFRLADVEDPVLPVAHQVATRLRRNLLQPTLKHLRLYEQRRHGQGVRQRSLNRRSSIRCWPWSEPHRPLAIERF